nr:unnamed protein product [Spirometra erinaceieuropaei]
MAKWLCRSLKFLTTEWNTAVRSPTQFLKKLKGDLAIKTIELVLRDKYNEKENRYVQVQIIQLLKFCLKTYFMFDGTICEQMKGKPMGLLVLGLIPEAVLQRLESQVFRQHIGSGLAIKTIELLLRDKYDGTENRPGQIQIIQLAKFCLKTRFASYKIVYEQMKCTPMISGLIVEDVLQRLESLVFRHHIGSVCG